VTADAVPTYRERLRLEGGVLAACGLAGSVLLLALADDATDGPGSTVAQLALVAVLLVWFAPRAVRSWAAKAEPVAPGDPVSGDPTPLWQLPLICAGLALAFGLPFGAWDAALRVTGGCALVGLAQAVLLDRVAAGEERRRGGTLVRLPGSSLFTGTKLGLRA
jgi:hypothetical protein